MTCLRFAHSFYSYRHFLSSNSKHLFLDWSTILLVPSTSNLLHYHCHNYLYKTYIWSCHSFAWNSSHMESTANSHVSPFSYHVLASTPSLCHSLCSSNTRVPTMFPNSMTWYCSLCLEWHSHSPAGSHLSFKLPLNITPQRSSPSRLLLLLFHCHIVCVCPLLHLPHFMVYGLSLSWNCEIPEDRNWILFTSHSWYLAWLKADAQ